MRAITSKESDLASDRESAADGAADDPKSPQGRSDSNSSPNIQRIDTPRTRTYRYVDGRYIEVDDAQQEENARPVGRRAPAPDADNDVSDRHPSEVTPSGRYGFEDEPALRGPHVRDIAKTRVQSIIELPQVSPGTERYITVLKYGTAGVGPKAYLHAGLHADEIPGMLVLNHLMRRLNAADDRGDIAGECVVVPVANPIGASQFVHGQVQGRFDLNSGQNFNRHYPVIADQVAERCFRHLRGDPDFDKKIVRGAMRAVLNDFQSPDPLEHMRARLLELACDADLVLDIHCDEESVLHMYLGTPLWPDASDLHRQLGSEATLLARVSGGHPFDEACSSVWWDLDERLKDHIVEPNCLAATIELRGQGDVSDEMAARDADNIYRFLQRRGVVKGDPGVLPEARSNPTPLEGVDVVRSPVSGVVTFNRHPGEYVRKNDTVAVIVDPLTTHGQSARTAVIASTSGVLFARTSSRVTRPGQVLCKIAGPTPLEGRAGNLLHD